MKQIKLKKEKKKPEKAIRKKAPEKKTKTGQTGKSKLEKKLRVLILEDNPADAELMERQLKKDGITFVSQRVESKSNYLKALKTFQPDLILADYKLPKFDALQALALRSKMAPQTPFIIITGTISEETAVECMKQGADDYLLKDRLARLGEAIRQSLDNRRLQAEKYTADRALLAAATQWRATFDAMNDAVCLLDGQGAVQKCNRAMNLLLGLPFEKIIGRDCLDLVCGKDKRKSCAFTQMMKTRQRKEEETFWRGHWYQVRVDPVIDSNGKLVGAVHIMTDFTQSKRAGESLRASTVKLAQAQRIGKLGSWEWNLEGNSLEWSDELYRIWGVDKDLPLTVESIAAMIHPDDLAGNQTMVQKFLSEQNQGGFDFRIICPDGAVKHIHQHIEVTRAPSGQAVRMFGIMQDITAHKQAEEKLRFFALAVESSFDAIGMSTPDGRHYYQNRAFDDLFGYVGENPPAILYGDEQVGREVFRTIMGGNPWIGEVKMKAKAGELLDILLRAYAIKDDTEKILGLVGIHTNITERKKAEEELKKLAAIVQYSSELVNLATLEGKMIFLNEAGSKMLGIDPDKIGEHFILEVISESFLPKVNQLLLPALQAGNTWEGELQYRNIRTGRLTDVHAMTFTIKDPDSGTPLYLANVSRDISEHKQAEELIRASLKEKEVLLKEIHHRVKNNLQVISGLLTLQAAQIGDERLQRVLKDSQSRIWTMALIHQTLYQTDNLAAIDMADYIRSLSGNLLSSHARVAMPPAITFNLLPLRLVIDKAIPLALIINELLTNAMKHAFPDGRPGEIRITLQECRDRSLPVTTEQENPPTYELIVADDGVGLPSGFDLKNQKSLGLQLVTMLAKQLDGKLTIESKGGTSVAITFNSDEKN